MRAYDIVGYKADADIWCVSCARVAYPGCDDLADVEDHEGNLVHPIFAVDEGWPLENCGGCHAVLDDCQ